MSISKNIELEEKIKNGVVIRGTGVHAARCTYLMQKLGVRILCFIDCNPGLKLFRRKPVYGINDNPHKKALMIVATKISTYNDIANELRKESKREFVDFIYYEWLFKDIVLLHGNCHMEVLKDFLYSDATFEDRYAIYPYPLLVSSTDTFRTEPEIFQNIDIWIHEDIRNNNLFGYEVSDEYIRSNLGKHTREIKIPHLYGISKMFFPQLIVKNDGKNEALNGGKDTDGMFLYGDGVIEKCIEQNMELNEIVRFCMSDTAIPKEDILSNYRKCIEKVKDREKSWNIKISEFIENNYKMKKLFYDPGHPTNVIMEYIANEVLKGLGIKSEAIKCSKLMDAHEEPIYPCVKKTLGIAWEDDELRKNGKKLYRHMDFAEYIKEYCWWRHYEIYQDQI